MTWIHRVDSSPRSDTFGWPVRSVERLPPFDLSKLKNPVLVIGNTVRRSLPPESTIGLRLFCHQADPITPFASAQAAAKLIGNRATLVEQLGVGHVSVAQFSSCTLGIVANYVLASKVSSSPSVTDAFPDPRNAAA